MTEESQTDSPAAASSRVSEGPKPGTATVGHAPQDSPKRLPFLWVACVLLGLGGMLSLTLTLSMRPFGAVVCGGLAGLDLGLAVVLYLRLRAGWYAAMALLALAFAWDLIGGLTVFHRSAWAIAVGCLIDLGVALYLWNRRRWFLGRGALRPRVLWAPVICALAAVLGLGGSYLLLMTVDDARQSFPALEVQVPTPPDGQNGFLLLEEMRAKWPLLDDKKYEKLMQGRELVDGKPSAAWLAEARPLLKKYADCLRQGAELVKEPHFVEVPRLHGVAWEKVSVWRLEFVRRLAVLLDIRAELQAADGHWSQALDSADMAVQLGVLLDRESTRTLQSLASDAVVQIGMSSLQEVAGSAPDASILEAHLGPPLPEAAFRDGFDLGMAGEFQGTVGVMQSMANGGYDALHSVGPDIVEWRPRSVFGLLVQKQMKGVQLEKANMTYNVFGRLLLPCVIRGGTYEGPRQSRLWKRLEGGSVVHAFGLLHVVRNPIGDILVGMLAPALERSVDSYFNAVAESRMTQLFVALRCYQLERGALPASLDTLAPEYLKTIPVDPFTGKPFGYEPTGKEPRIWSVGPDRVTDKSRVEGGDDEVVELEFAGK